MQHTRTCTFPILDNLFKTLPIFTYLRLLARDSTTGSVLNIRPITEWDTTNNTATVDDMTDMRKEEEERGRKRKKDGGRGRKRGK